MNSIKEKQKGPGSVTMSSTSGSQGFLQRDDDLDADSSSSQFLSHRNMQSSTRGASVMSELSCEFTPNRSSITAALAPRPRKSNDLSDFTIDKLNFTSLGLHGRERELELLKNAQDTLMSCESSEQERQLILISGYSGTGKTALANIALKKSTEKLGGLFVRGKFDLNLRNEPYSGINSACAEICGAILELRFQKTDVFEQLCNQIKSELGAELSLLIQVIPILAEVVDCDLSGHPIIENGLWEDQSTQGSGKSSTGSKDQFNFAFIRFIRTISYQFVPLVFVLDDLQWADGASLDLLEALLTDSGSSKLMVVGMYRSNEVDETHIFHRIIEDLEVKSKDKYFEMTRLEIGNLDFEAVHRIIVDLLGMDNNSRTLGLADICYNKTYGNAFFLLQFLSMLKERQLLQFNFGTVSWTWDDEEIESKTSASDNVVDLLKAKMAKLSKDLIDILKLASYLGSTFETATLNMVWERSAELALEDDDNMVTTSLETLEMDGYIKKHGSNPEHQSYSWSHDKIQEAALTLVPDAERGDFAAKVGRILLSHLDEKDLESAIFVVVNLLNGGDEKLVKDDRSRLELARLNHQASRKAISFSAFESAAQYAAEGIRLLPPNAWVDHYELTLDIHTIGAQAEGFIGNTERMEHYCKQVILQEDRPIQDKFEVYHTWIDSVANHGRLDEARDLSLDILKKFKCNFPRNPALIGLGIVRNVVQVKATMKSRDSSALRILDDSTRIELMKILDRLATVFYMAQDDRMPLVVFRSLNWTVKYGYCDYSAPAFATTGMMLTGILNDLRGGSTYGEQALVLMERSKSQIKAPRTMFCVYSFLFPWTKPVRSLLKPLLRSYDIGLQTGDTESATWSIFHWLCIKLMIGSSLESLEADSILYLKQMKALKRWQAVGSLKNYRQVFLNLLGCDNVDDPTNFTGASLSEEDLERHLADPFLNPGAYYCQGMLFTYFGEHVRHADWAIKMGHDHVQKGHVASPNNMWDTLYKGVSCFAAARATGKKKYAKLGQIFRSKIKKWIEMGNPNVHHYESLLDAESLAFQGKKFAAIKNYEVAILLAGRGGYQHDAALATERLGEFQLNVMGDKEEAAYKIGQSIKYWGEWGAMAKVHHLQSKYSDLMPQPTEIVTKSHR